MAGPTRTLTDFGKDLDLLLKRAGKFTLREYADECGVSYKYLSQLRTMPQRRPGRLYVDLLKPFAKLRTVNLDESQSLSLRHRGKPLSFTECKELFPHQSEQQIVESVRRATEVRTPNETAIVEAKHDPGLSSEVATRRQAFHRVFVGRLTELNELRSAFDAAGAGSGSIVMVSGEPGIGKTTICNQLKTYVSERGGTSLTGRCYESEPRSLPYFAIVEALRSYVTERDTDLLTRELGAGAPDVARILHELGERLRLGTRAVGDPVEERFRLLEAVAAFLGSISAAKPLLVVLEDLHAADGGTLEMLQFIARNLGGKRIMLLGTFRDTEVGREHPLSSVLAELRRSPSFSRISLHGLDADEVARMLSGIMGRDAPAGISQMVYRQTEGNPLFVEEVARYLTEHRVAGPASPWTASSQTYTVGLNVPNGIREVIGRRLSGLSRSCYLLLSKAAVIGRDFRLDILQKVAAMSEDRMFKALEEARDAALIEERRELGSGVSYHFSHAFFRQTLYEDIIAPKRADLHRQVGQALEGLHRGALHNHAAELAEHFSQSLDSSDLRKAVSYWEMAANLSASVYSYDESSHALQKAVGIVNAVLPDDKAKRCDLLIATCEQLWLASEWRRLLDTEAPAALSLAAEMGDRGRASTVCRLAMWAVMMSGAGASQAWATEEAREWVSRADQWALAKTRGRAWADFGLAMTKVSRGTLGNEEGLLAEGLVLLIKTIKVARHLGDLELLWTGASEFLLHAHQLPWHQDRLRIAKELAGMPRRGVSLFALGTGLLFSGFAYLEAGDRRRTEALWREHEALTQRTGQSYYRFQSMQTRGNLACIDGRLEEAVQIFRTMRTFGDEHGLSFTTAIIASVGACRPLLYLGRADEAFQMVSTFVPYGLATVVCLAHLGRDEEVVPMLDRRFVGQRSTAAKPDESASWDAAALEAAVIVKCRPAADLLLRAFSHSELVTPGILYPTCIPRHLGGAAALLGRYDEAREHYMEAIRVSTDMRFRPELAAQSPRAC